MEKEKCSERVWIGYHEQPCSRYAVRDGYCKQHHPDEVAKRNKISDEKWKAKMYNKPMSVAMRKIKALEKENMELRDQLQILKG